VRVDAIKQANKDRKAWLLASFGRGMHHCVDVYEDRVEVHVSAQRADHLGISVRRVRVA
jgi:hypothetical protein